MSCPGEATDCSREAADYGLPGLRGQATSSDAARFLPDVHARARMLSIVKASWSRRSIPG